MKMVSKLKFCAAALLAVILIAACSAPQESNYAYVSLEDSDLAQSEVNNDAAALIGEIIELLSEEIYAENAEESAELSRAERLLAREHFARDAARELGLPRMNLFELPYSFGMFSAEDLQERRFLTVNGVIRVSLMYSTDRAVFYLFEGNDRTEPLQVLTLDGVRSGSFYDLSPTTYYSIIAHMISSYNQVTVGVCDGTFKIIFPDTAYTEQTEADELRDNQFGRMHTNAETFPTSTAAVNNGMLFWGTIVEVVAPWDNGRVRVSLPDEADPAGRLVWIADHKFDFINPGESTELTAEEQARIAEQTEFAGPSLAEVRFEQIKLADIDELAELVNNEDAALAEAAYQLKQQLDV